jgi:hypothetical protein
MPRNSGGDDYEAPRRRRPATTPEGRESQMVALAYDLVEKRMREGTATSQETTHFLKLGSSREQLEQQRLRHENQLTQVKIEAIERDKERDMNLLVVIDAMRSYSGLEPIDREDEYGA